MNVIVMSRHSSQKFTRRTNSSPKIAAFVAHSDVLMWGWKLNVRNEEKRIEKKRKRMKSHEDSNDTETIVKVTYIKN